MSTPILTTKFYVPPPRLGLVPRPRLVERLNEGCAQGCRLTLISASAGFGKTTILGEWIGHLGKPAAWLSLEKEDNDPGRFWTYILEALRTIQPDLGKDASELQFTSPQFHTDAILTALINEIAAIPNPLLLILDDYHEIDSSSIQEGMIFLLDHLPAQLHLVIASRADPAWPLARWRTRGQLMEIRAADLRFAPEEAVDFLKRTMKLDLSTQEITALEERTEGWIAGLQMAALSLQGRKDVREFIDAFAGSNHYIFDYLIEEVLGRQPAEVQDFLLKTSILDHLNASLCDAILNQTDSRESLDKLEKANLFLIPLDDERHWYRYHHLFAELLCRRLEQTQPDQITDLHRCASRWYAANNFLTEAIKHALQSGDFLLVNELVSQNALAVVEYAELFDVLRPFEMIPEQELTSKPWLGVAYAWALMYAGRLQAAVLNLQNAEETLSVQGWPDGTDNRVRGHIKTIRAYIFLQEVRIDLADKLSREALELLPEMDLMARGFATMTIGLSLRLGNHFQEAERVLSEAVKIYRAAGSDHQTVIALCDLGAVQRIIGKLHQSYATNLEALRLADSHRQVKGGQFPALGYAYVHLSNILYDFNQIEESLDYARKGIELYRRWGSAEFLVDSYTSLAYILSAKGEWDEAFEIIRQARQIAANLSESYLINWVEPVEVIIHLRKGDVEFVAHWLERWEKMSEKTDREYVSNIDSIRVRCLMAQGRLDQALRLARACYEDSAKSNAVIRSITYLSCQVVILHLQHKDDQALEVLVQALSLAESGGYIHHFVDQGQPMYELLVQALHRGISPGYVEKLISAFGPEIKEIITARSHFQNKPDNIESLSERELEILRLLESSMNTPEIARELYISVGTVRTHIKNIYRKLDVNRRMEAVQRARELGLI